MKDLIIKRSENARDYTDDEVNLACSENKEDIKTLFDKIDSLKMWILGSLITMFIGFVGTIVLVVDVIK
jgi:hypothetical protein